MKEFMKHGSWAKIYCIAQDRPKFMGNIYRKGIDPDQYEILDYVNGCTMYFKSWQEAHAYVCDHMKWNAYYRQGNKEYYDDLFALC